MRPPPPPPQLPCLELSDAATGGSGGWRRARLAPHALLSPRASLERAGEAVWPSFHQNALLAGARAAGLHSGQRKHRGRTKQALNCPNAVECAAGQADGSANALQGSNRAQACRARPQQAQHCAAALGLRRAQSAGKCAFATGITLAAKGATRTVRRTRCAGRPRSVRGASARPLLVDAAAARRTPLAGYAASRTAADSPIAAAGRCRAIWPNDAAGDARIQHVALPQLLCGLPVACVSVSTRVWRLRPRPPRAAPTIAPTPRPCVGSNSPLLLPRLAAAAAAACSFAVDVAIVRAQAALGVRVKAAHGGGGSRGGAGQRRGR